MERKQILLAGGIGSGKSEVGRLLALRGACVIDADRVGHEVLKAGGEAFEGVASAFPEVVVAETIDRHLLAAAVFADPMRLRLLESLTHPAIRARIRRRVESCSHSITVVELPLISDFLGPGWLKVVVDAPEEVKLERLVGRGMDLEDVHLRVGAQPTRTEWRRAADFIVDNSGDREALEAEVDRLWDWLSA